MSGWAVPAVVLLASGAALMAITRLPRQQALAAGVLVAAGALALMRNFAAALPLAVIGIELWRRATGARAAPRPGQRSEVRTEALAMRLDRDSGEIDGEVLTGPLAGRMLSDLGGAELRDLVAELEAAGDEESLSLLLAYLDRRGATTRDEHVPPADGREMSREEARRVLGLAPGASIEEVRAAHHRLMKRVHPDLGGSGALAALINAAKDVLDPD